jgi:hypothetical protein
MLLTQATSLSVRRRLHLLILGLRTRGGKRGFLVGMSAHSRSHRSSLRMISTACPGCSRANSAASAAKAMAAFLNCGRGLLCGQGCGESHHRPCTPDIADHGLRRTCRAPIPDQRPHGLMALCSAKVRGLGGRTGPVMNCRYFLTRHGIDRAFYGLFD